MSKNPSTNATGKVVCVGRNYAAHASELGNRIPTRPILFIKPASSISSVSEAIPASFTDHLRGKRYPVHYEAELCLRLGEDLKNASKEEVMTRTGLIDAVTLGLDLTLRDLQSELKQKGHPWERAKCFDGATVLADWLDIDTVIDRVTDSGSHSNGYADNDIKNHDFSSIKYQLLINDKLTQDGDTALMLFPIYDLLVEISHAFSLQAGDIIMTGTPSGVGVLQAQDTLTLALNEHHWQTQVV